MRHILEHGQRRTTIGDDAAWWLARPFDMDGKEKEAAAAYGVLLRDYSWCAYAKRVRGRYEPAGPVRSGASD